MPYNKVSRRRGQAIIETAFVIVALLALTMGLIQFGLIYFTQSALINLTRDSTRYAAIHGMEPDVVNKVRTYVRDKANQSGGFISSADFPDANVSVTPAPGLPGQRITVAITYDMTKKFFMPVPEWGLGATNNRWKNYKTTLAMTIE